jgi:DNA polymerase bacteriophage-type
LGRLESRPGILEREGMSLLHIDFEVYSEVSIKEAPLDVYAFHPSTKIILAAYAFDDGPVKVWQESDGPLVELREGLKNEKNTIVAWNVNYERTVLRGRGLCIPIERWLDPMVHARYAGLPGRLKDVAKIPLVGVPAEEKTKSETLLINRFCMPKEGRRVMPAEYPEDWAKFTEYCRKDVQTMRHVLNWLTPRFPFPDSERELWILDQKINERGLPVDVEMAAHAEKQVQRLAAESGVQLKALTGLENPDSVQQLLPWLKDNGYPYDSLGKEFLAQALNDTTLTAKGREVALLRSGAAKASVKKFRTIVEMASPEVL